MSPQLSGEYGDEMSFDDTNFRDAHLRAPHAFLGLKPGSRRLKIWRRETDLMPVVADATGGSGWALQRDYTGFARQERLNPGIVFHPTAEAGDREHDRDHSQPLNRPAHPDHEGRHGRSSGWSNH